MALDPYLEALKSDVFFLAPGGRFLMPTKFDRSDSDLSRVLQYLVSILHCTVATST